MRGALWVRSSGQSKSLPDCCQRGAEACFKFDEHVSFTRGAGPRGETSRLLFDGDPDQHRERPRQKTKGDPRVKYDIVLRSHRARSILRGAIETFRVDSLRAHPQSLDS
jgi:hypothetical protein